VRPAPDGARLERLRQALSDTLPGTLGIRIDEAGDGVLRASMPVAPRVMAPNGYLHGGSVVALADTACGIGCWLGLPEDGPGFTTIELKSNFIGAARGDRVRCTARRAHGGRTTEVWDATVEDDDGRPVALFRCTQLILGTRG
jgi:1,4-dihydroxy-2-naphthoyl-CoA hydrolase